MITLIEQQKRRKNRYNIFLNHEYAFSIHEDVLVKHRLSKGLQIDEGRLSQLIHDEEQQNAFLQAIRFISHKPRSKKEIENKLSQNGYEEEIIQVVMHKLMEQKYVDDQEYAKALTEYRIHSQKKGRRWIMQELVHKGIPKSFADQAIEQINEETEYQLAYELGSKRWERQTGSLLDRKRKVAGFLLRRGYTNDLVNRVISKLQANSMNDEDDLRE